MAPGGDIEMNRLSRLRSAADDSIFTMPGPGTSHTTVSDPGHSGSNRSSGRDNRGHGHAFKSHINHFIDSFRRQEASTNLNPAFHNPYTDADDGNSPHHHPSPGERYYDLRTANAKTASTLLARELKNRHLQMIAIGGSIGTGLFVASGKALSQGGPASVLLAYLVVGVMLWCTMQALGEMAVVFPVAGSFSAFSTRFLDPSWGFAMGWK